MGKPRQTRDAGQDPGRGGEKAPPAFLQRGRSLRDAIEALPLGRFDRWPGGTRRFLARARDLGGDPVRDEVAAALGAHHDRRPLDLEALRIVTMALAWLGDTSGFAGVLARFDPALPPLPRRFDFTGEGNGLQSLNVYLRSAPHFGKLYVNDAPSLIRMRFALRQVLPALGEVPHARLQREAEGRHLSLLWFDLLPEMRVRPRDGFLLCAVAELVQALAATRSEGRPDHWQGQPIPPESIEPLRPILVRGERALLDHAGRRLAPALSRWKARVWRGPWVFAHGDLHPSNLRGDGVAVDWDGSGFLPVGFDAACAVNTLSRARDLATVDRLWERLFRPAVTADPGHDRAAFLLFLAHVALGRPGGRRNAPLVDEILAELAAVWPA